MAKVRVLVVDDEEGMLEVCADALTHLENAHTVVEQHSAQAVKLLSAGQWDLLITDLCMPGLDGMDLLRQARHFQPDLAVLIITAHPTVETAVACMKLGAADYLVKPFLPEQLLQTVEHLLTNQQLRTQNQLLRRQIEQQRASGDGWNKQDKFSGILGRSSVMQTVFENIQRLAQTNLDVLIEGETGTGKELVARALHQESARRRERFVPIDCGAVPEELMESEFFGHERGAFTGALESKVGLLEHAQLGTVFLDEFAQLPLRLQAKLLRVLQERKIRRVGGTHEINLDVRVITASSVSLDEEVKQGRFRMDLYQRINVAYIRLPCLRERQDDIPLLAHHFLERHAREMNRGDATLSADAMAALTFYSWPGNIRELQNVIRRTLALTRGPLITLEDLPGNIAATSAELSAVPGTGYFAMRERRLLAFEREYLINQLNSSHGDVSNAAREAQLPRGTFYRLLRKHVINPEDFRAH